MNFLKLLFNLVLFLGCSYIWFAESNSCTNLLPENALLTHGFDLASLDLRDIDPQTNVPTAFRGQLFSPTCDRNQMQDGYQLADQVELADYRQNPHCFNDHYEGFYEVEICSTLECFLREMGSLRNVKIPGAFSNTRSYKWAQKVIGIMGNVVGEVACYGGKYFSPANGYIITLKDNGSIVDVATFLTKSFADFAKKLATADVYIKSNKIYDLLLDQYGSHFFVSGIFVNLQYTNITIDEAYYQSFSKPANPTDLSLNYYLTELMRGKTGELPKEFIQHTQMATIKRFLDPKKPVLAKGTIKPISELFKNKTTSSQVKIAIDVHLTKANLRKLNQDLQLIIEAEPYYNWLLIGYYSPNSLRKQIEKLLNDVIPDKKVIKDSLEPTINAMLGYVSSLHRSHANS